MRYRTRQELARLSLAEVLRELDTLKIEPAEQTVFALDSGHDAQGVPIVGEPPAYLSDAQKQECRETGATRLTLQQQAEQGGTLAVWRLQLYAHGVAAYVASLGLKRCLAHLKERKAEMTLWEGRHATRQEVEKRLTAAIHNEVEQREENAST
ncbi:MAG: hypothetical protein ABL983_07770 [Nitrospira sp.]